MCMLLDNNIIRSYVPGGDRFPGALPVGMRRATLNYICDPQNRNRYVVTNKLDGVRKLLVMCPEGTFLVARDMTVHRLSDVAAVSPCVLDGEYMNETFFAFDLLVLAGEDVRSQPFVSRYMQLSTLDNMPEMSRVKEMVPLGDLETLVQGMPAEVDGLIFVDQESTYDFEDVFSLVKWKPTPTFDVLVRMKDLCNRDGRPLVRTQYWEYSDRHQKSRPVTFEWCTTTETQRLALWRQKKTTASVMCVECFCDPSGTWRILRGRPDKNRSNSSRTIDDTRCLLVDNVQLVDIQTAIGDGTRTLSVGQDVQDGVCRPLTWLAHTWAHASDICELELRLTHAGKTSLPSAMFHRIVGRLQTIASMVQTTIDSIDYTCGAVRVTHLGKSSYAIHKDTPVRCMLGLPSMDGLGLTCALSYEHPRPVVRVDDFSTRRDKHRWRFVHRGTVAIDCTHVRSCTHAGDTADSYEIEIESLRSSRYRSIEYSACSGIILSMIWRMLKFVLDADVYTTPLVTYSERPQATRLL